MRYLIILIVLFFCSSCTSGQTYIQKEIDSDSINRKASYFLEKGNLDSARLLIEMALKIDPNNHGIYNNRAYLKFKENKPAIEVISDYKHSLKLLPNNQVALYSIANYYFEVNDYKNALISANDYIERSKTDNIDPGFMNQILRIKEKSEWEIHGYNRVVDGITIGKAIKFYDSINEILHQVSPIQQKFIDKLSVGLAELSKNEKITINLGELTFDLDSAITSVEEDISKIEKVNEVDLQINYKQLVLNYRILLINLYKNEFAEVLGFLKTSDLEGFKRRSDDMQKRFMKLKSLEFEFKQAQLAFKKKYGFTTPKE